MKQLKELDVLSKYLSDDELKEIAKDVAKEEIHNYLGMQNLHRHTNFEFYVTHGAFEAVKEYASSFDKEKLANSLNERVEQIIQNMQSYELPETYDEMVNEALKNNKDRIQFKIHKLVSRMINDEDEWPNLHSTFSNYVGGVFADLLYDILEKNFKENS